MCFETATPAKIQCESLLLLAVLEMRLDQRLQLVEVLLHTLPVYVLGWGGGRHSEATAPAGQERSLGVVGPTGAETRVLSDRVPLPACPPPSMAGLGAWAWGL